MILKTGGHMTDTNIIKFPTGCIVCENEEKTERSFCEPDAYFSSEQAQQMGIECAVVFQQLFEDNEHAVIRFGENYLSVHPDASNHEIGKAYIHTPSAWIDIRYAEYAKYFPYWTWSKVKALIDILAKKQCIIRHPHPDNEYAKFKRYYIRLFVQDESTELGSPYLNWDKNSFQYNVEKYHKKTKTLTSNFDHSKEAFYKMQLLIEKIKRDYDTTEKAIENILMTYGWSQEAAEKDIKQYGLDAVHKIFREIVNNPNTEMSHYWMQLDKYGAEGMPVIKYIKFRLENKKTRKH